MDLLTGDRTVSIKHWHPSADRESANCQESDEDLFPFKVHVFVVCQLSEELEDRST